MRKFWIAALFAIGLGACSNDADQSSNGTIEMTELSAIRDLWDFGDPAVSETRFRELAADAEAAGNGAYAAEAMTQVARTFSLRRDFDQANANLDMVDGGAFGEVPVVRVRSLLERGRALNSGGQPDAALPHFEEAYEIAAANGEDFLAGDALHMAGIASDLESEERWLNALVEFVAANPDTPADYWFAAMRNNLGWSFFSAERYDDALAQFRLSRDAYAEMDGKRYETLIADYSTGRTMRFLGECAEALPLQEATYAALEAEFETQDEYVTEEIALCRAALGNAEGAREAAAIAFAKFSEDSWFVENEAERLEALRELSGN